MRTVVIVLFDPSSDAQLGLIEVLVFIEPHLLFFQAAMEPFDVAVALGKFPPVARRVPRSVAASYRCQDLAVYIIVTTWPLEPRFWHLPTKSTRNSGRCVTADLARTVRHHCYRSSSIIRWHLTLSTYPLGTGSDLVMQALSAPGGNFGEGQPDTSLVYSLWK